ncbi:MAG: quinone oxidoreductase, partial [Acetobacteraceae bacterium]
MKAAVVTSSGVQVIDVAEPKPGPHEVMVRVRASGLNRADLGVAAGHAHGRMGGAGTILGLEFAGEIVAVGTEVPAEFTPGLRVMCSGNGGYAEYAVADWGRTTPLPDSNMSWAQAATLPVALQTMHDAIMTNGALKPGQTILIQGASSGVGLMGMQIAKAMGASQVFGSSTNAARRAKLAEFGCDLAIDTSDAAWPDQVLAATEGRGVDVIIDQVSASVANANMRACAILGRIVNVGRLGGAKGEFDFDLHALRRIAYIGVTFRTRSVAEVREINRRMRADLWPAVEAGKLALPIDRVFPLAEAVAALEHMRNNQ